MCVYIYIIYSFDVPLFRLQNHFNPHVIGVGKITFYWQNTLCQSVCVENKFDQSSCYFNWEWELLKDKNNIFLPLQPHQHDIAWHTRHKQTSQTLRWRRYNCRQSITSVRTRNSMIAHLSKTTVCDFSFIIPKYI